MRISDWSSDVCSSDLCGRPKLVQQHLAGSSRSVRAAALPETMPASAPAASLAISLRPASVPTAQVDRLGAGRVRYGEASVGGTDRPLANSLRYKTRPVQPDSTYPYRYAQTTIERLVRIEWIST